MYSNTFLQEKFISPFPAFPEIIQNAFLKNANRVAAWPVYGLPVAQEMSLGLDRSLLSSDEGSLLFVEQMMTKEGVWEAYRADDHYPAKFYVAKLEFKDRVRDDWKLIETAVNWWPEITLKPLNAWLANEFRGPNQKKFQCVKDRQSLCQSIQAFINDCGTGGEGHIQLLSGDSCSIQEQKSTVTIVMERKTFTRLFLAAKQKQINKQTLHL